MLATLTPALFARTASRGKWQMAAMHELIDEALTDTITGRTEPVLIVETPPRHGKSQLISKWFPAWHIAHYPDRQVILTSATADLAVRFGRQVRSVVREWGPVFGVAVSDERGSADDWETTAGGGMRTAGVGGDVMGRGFHLGIVDDFLRNSEEARSHTIRDKQWDWWQSTFSTRLEPGGCIVVMATRWSEDDLIGRLLKAAEEGEGLPVRRIRLPAIAEDDDPLGREPGEALWPERWPLGNETERVVNDYGDRVPGLLMRKRMMGSHWWNAQFQQRPTRDGVTAFPDAYFGPHIWPAEWPDAFEVSAIAVDPSKGKDAKRGDFTAIVFAGLNGGRIYLDALVGRYPPTELIRRLLSFVQRYNPDAVGCEGNQFQSLFADLIDRVCAEMGLPPLGVSLFENRVAKELRIERLGPYLDRDQLRFHPNSPGARELVRQLKDFPLGDHDDAPDGAEMAIRLLHQVAGAGVEMPPDEEIAYA